MSRIALFAAALALASPVQSQQVDQCGSIAVIAKQLKDGYGEEFASQGVQANGVRMVIFANGDTGTYTVTLTPPGRLTCIVAAGKDYQQSAPKTGDPV